MRYSSGLFCVFFFWVYVAGVWNGSGSLCVRKNGQGCFGCKLGFYNNFEAVGMAVCWSTVSALTGAVIDEGIKWKGGEDVGGD